MLLCAYQWEYVWAKLIKRSVIKETICSRERGTLQDAPHHLLLIVGPRFYYLFISAACRKGLFDEFLTPCCSNRLKGNNVTVDSSCTAVYFSPFGRGCALVETGQRTPSRLMKPFHTHGHFCKHTGGPWLCGSESGGWGGGGLGGGCCGVL